MFRLAIAGSVALLWCQFLLTSRWAHVDGSFHGPKRIFYLVALVLASMALLTWKRRTAIETSHEGRPVGVAGLGLLATAVWIWFPPSAWTQLPYLDNWPTRFQSTVDGAALLRQGSATGWNWFFLGGYSLATDITQNLALLALVPVTVLGDEVGFHLLHAVLLFAIPLLVFADLRLAGERSAAWLALGLTCVTVAGLSFPLFRSGDTNSLAGVCMTMAVILGSHAARTGRRWGGPLLVSSLIVLAWSHVGFLIYAAILITGDLMLARAWRHAWLIMFGVAVALVASLPLTWELWRYPSLFLANNVRFDPDEPIVWRELAQQIFYNAELFWLPGRWFNDYTGLTRALLPVLAWAALVCRRRMAFYAAGAVVMLSLLLLNAAEFGYVFQRPVHLLTVLTPVAVVGLLVEAGASTWRRLAVVAFVFLYIQVWWRPVPHIESVRLVEPALVRQLSAADGAMVLIENTFHRDMDRSPDRRSDPTPVPVHLERVLSEATGQRFYAGMWDGMQWVPFRQRLLSGGTFQGVPIEETPHQRFTAEMRRWGVRELAVWSDAARSYLDSAPGYVATWAAVPWYGYRLEDADVRSVTTPGAGAGSLDNLTPFGATVTLTGLRQGDRVVVRTSYHPSWTAEAEGQEVPLVDDQGQLAFDAPRGGDVAVRLAYPKRTGLLWLAGTVAIIALWVSQWLVGSLRGRDRSEVLPRGQSPSPVTRDASAPMRAPAIDRPDRREAHARDPRS